MQQQENNVSLLTNTKKSVIICMRKPYSVQFHNTVATRCASSGQRHLRGAALRAQARAQVLQRCEAPGLQQLAPGRAGAQLQRVLPAPASMWIHDCKKHILARDSHTD